MASIQTGGRPLGIDNFNSCTSGFPHAYLSGVEKVSIGIDEFIGC